MCVLGKIKIGELCYDTGNQRKAVFSSLFHDLKKIPKKNVYKCTYLYDNTNLTENIWRLSTPLKSNTGNDTVIKTYINRFRARI